MLRGDKVAGMGTLCWKAYLCQPLTVLTLPYSDLQGCDLRYKHKDRMVKAAGGPRKEG